MHARGAKQEEKYAIAPRIKSVGNKQLNKQAMNNTPILLYPVNLWQESA